MIKNIFLTGMPKSGKSTLLHNIVDSRKPKVGFITYEINVEGERKGFELVTSAGDRAVLAHKDSNSTQRISHYGVDLEAFDRCSRDISIFSSNDLLYIDEIGQMQLLSESFRKIARAYFDAPNLCIATLCMNYVDDFIRDIPQRRDSLILEITPNNRNTQQATVNYLISRYHQNAII